MKTIGLIGGMSWESTQVYYQIINRKTNELLGKHHSARCFIYSLDFETIVDLQHREKWGKLNKLMMKAAQTLEKAGADIIVLCTNTMHFCSKAIQQNINIPFLHIAKATGIVIQKQGLNKVALLGTKFTMEKDFYKNILLSDFAIETIIPTAESRQVIHDIIYEELVLGKITDQSRKTLLGIIASLEKNGAEGIILGCTELPLLIKPEDTSIPLFDTARIHAEAAVLFTLL